MTDYEIALRLLKPTKRTVIDDDIAVETVASAEEILMRIRSSHANRDVILRVLGGRPSDSGYMRRTVWEFEEGTEA